jgi:hypothetical protein
MEASPAAAANQTPIVQLYLDTSLGDLGYVGPERQSYTIHAIRA